MAGRDAGPLPELPEGMDAQTLGHLIRIRQFPPVVHARHAMELVSGEGAASLAEWAGGYALAPAIQREVAELLASLAWGTTGQALLVNGRYGTGKSHLLVLTHLLAALPAAWGPFSVAYPSLARCAAPCQARRPLVVHLSLEEYGARISLEHALYSALAEALAAAGCTRPAALVEDGNRLDAWHAVLAAGATEGRGGLLVLIDELSLFLAGRSPARREADAALLQFLAGLSARAPVWVLGALQRTLTDVGALRTHSWRQVEDRFRYLTLTPQPLGTFLCAKCLERQDPVAIRLQVTQALVPQAERQGVEVATADFLQQWPFHPVAVELLVEVVNTYLSPHRTVVAVLQSLGDRGLLERPSTQLLTVVDVLAWLEEDLRGDPRLADFWQAVVWLRTGTEALPEPDLGRQAIDGLAVAFLAGRTIAIAELREWLFAGGEVPAVEVLSTTLHTLRRRGAFLAVQRHADPGAEVFSLAVDDTLGAEAVARMQEVRQNFASADRRVLEAIVEVPASEEWPLAAIAQGMRLPIPWLGSTRQVQLELLAEVTPDRLARLVEGMLAGQVDGVVALAWPGGRDLHALWQRHTATVPEAVGASLWLWHPRPPTTAEWALWSEWTAWQMAARQAESAATRWERQVAQRCARQAQELIEAVAASVRGLFRDGDCVSAQGSVRPARPDAGLGQQVTECQESGLACRFAAFVTLTPHGVPSRTAVAHLLTYLLEPGTAVVGTQTLLGDFIERYLMPLHSALLADGRAQVMAPPWELIAPIYAVTEDGPVRWTHAVEALGRPPLGLTHEQAHLVLAAALQTGVLAPLDSFLHPVLPETGWLTTGRVAFVTLPAMVAEEERALVEELARHWAIRADAWPMLCGQVEQALRRWLVSWRPRLSSLQAIMTEWSALMGCLPGQWQRSDRALTMLAALEPTAPLETLLAGIREEGVAPLTLVERLGTASDWWQEHHLTLAMLEREPLPRDCRDTAQALYGRLREGEACLEELRTLDERLAQLLTDYRTAYRQWHSATFGPEVIQGLRAVFEHAAFRALKQLATLPLPPPAMAQRALGALEEARGHYCPGDLEAVTIEGRCGHCHLSLGSTSPLPSPSETLRWTAEGLAAYAACWREHPWGAQVRQHLVRASDEVHAQVQRWLDWQVGDDPAELLSALDARTLAWLGHTGGLEEERVLADLARQLCGQELTLRDARSLVLTWLAPKALAEETLLRFVWATGDLPEITPEELGQGERGDRGRLGPQNALPQVYGEDAVGAQ